MATAEKHQQDPKHDATRGPNELFKYSAWVHVGQDAEECEHRETGDCQDVEHFHAWCRLPNQLQHDDIRERALAAKARRIRQLRDPEADGYEILESDMSELRRLSDPSALVDELVNKDWWKRQLEAMSDVEESEDFKTIDKDRERLGELRALDPDQRPKDEFEELERHVSKYMEAIDTRRVELEGPMREAIEALTLDELIGQIREERISAEAASAFMEMYSRWEWFAGTFTSNAPISRKRTFSDLEQLTEAAPEVLEALGTTFPELEASLQRGPKGN
jgi:hypothetical protein